MNLLEFMLWAVIVVNTGIILFCKSTKTMVRSGILMALILIGVWLLK